MLKLVVVLARLDNLRQPFRVGVAEAGEAGARVHHEEEVYAHVRHRAQALATVRTWLQHGQTCMALWRHASIMAAPAVSQNSISTVCVLLSGSWTGQVASSLSKLVALAVNHEALMCNRKCALTHSPSNTSEPTDVSSLPNISRSSLDYATRQCYGKVIATMHASVAHLANTIVAHDAHLQTL